MGGKSWAVYMSFCWENYIKNGLIIDLIIWEFFINDFFFEDYNKYMQKFMKSVLFYPYTSPALIFVKFTQSNMYPGNEITCLVPNPLFLSKKQIVAINLKKFQITAIDMQKIICENIQKQKYNLSKSKYFISHHPSHITHAQIGYSLINYIRNEFLYFLQTID